jgi:polyhydroxyalkanoate synthase
MATSFNMLRANDLVWSFFINNYLLGKPPFAFDLLYWNADSTRMPAAMHRFYLRNMYQHNKLSEPGGITLNDTPIDLGKVTIPTYFLSTFEDHIAPWPSTYVGTQLLQGSNRFVLGGSGHIAGVINPPQPDKPKYGYWTNATIAPTPEEWFEQALQHEGSWWPDWESWISALDNEQVAPRQPGDSGLKVIEEAPGSYAGKRLA